MDDCSLSLFAVSVSLGITEHLLYRRFFSAHAGVDVDLRARSQSLGGAPACHPSRPPRVRFLFAPSTHYNILRFPVFAIAPSLSHRFHLISMFLSTIEIADGRGTQSRMRLTSCGSLWRDPRWQLTTWPRQQGDQIHLLIDQQASRVGVPHFGKFYLGGGGGVTAFVTEGCPDFHLLVSPATTFTVVR